MAETWMPGPDARWIDISRPLGPATRVWPGDRPVEIETRRHSAGDIVWRVSRLALSVHAGTHLDAPGHMLPGAAGIGDFPPSLGCGPARVVDTAGAAVDEAAARQALGAERVLFRTGTSPAGREFEGPFGFITAAAARILADGGARLVGIDTPSVDAFADETAPAHRILFAAGIYLLENLDLAAVAPGEYRLWVTPLPLGDLDASPVRPWLSPCP
jgi:arylformamidase